MGVVLLWLAVAATLVAASIAATGGYTFDALGLRASMHAVSRPIVAAIAFGVLGVGALGTGARAEADRLYVRVGRDAALIAGTFAIIIGIATFEGGAQIAGGTDYSGYLRQARRWRQAR